MSLAIIFVLQINNSYAQVDKNENAITDGLSAVRRVKFNQEAIDKIKSLTDQNTKVDPNLPKNRTNPF